MAKSNSAASVSLPEKIRYWAQLTRMRMSNPSNKGMAARELKEMRHYVAAFEQQTGLKAKDSTVVEIGFGARPRRLMMMTGFFKKVYGIDLEAPVLSFGDTLRAARRNGLERAAKSIVRHALFERGAWDEFHGQMRAELPDYDPDKASFVLGSAALDEVWDQIGEVDLVFSIDVFEHIPPEDLRIALVKMREHLSPGGIVITRPCVYTGVGGNHLPDWYPYVVEEQTDHSMAWIHLIDPDFRVNTYLNKVTRGEFKTMFEEAGFNVLRDEAIMGRLGEKFLTPEKKAQLADWDDYELFSNKVEYFLRPKDAGSESRDAA